MKKYKDPFKGDSELRSLIIAILKRRIGLGVELFGLLSIDELEQGRYRVLDQRDPEANICDGEETVFKSVKAAVEYFLKVRDERKLGFDFERGGGDDSVGG